jgi:hypothetical protein
LVKAAEFCVMDAKLAPFRYAVDPAEPDLEATQCPDESELATPAEPLNASLTRKYAFPSANLVARLETVVVVSFRPSSNAPFVGLVLLSMKVEI